MINTSFPLAKVMITTIFEGGFFDDCRIEWFIDATKHPFYPETFTDFARRGVFFEQTTKYLTAYPPASYRLK